MRRTASLPNRPPATIQDAMPESRACCRLLSQARLWPSNFKESKAQFFAGGCCESPVLKYRHPVAPHELERFTVHMDYLPLAKQILDRRVARRPRA